MSSKERIGQVLPMTKIQFRVSGAILTTFCVNFFAALVITKTLFHLSYRIMDKAPHKIIWAKMSKYDKIAIFA